jgi:dihydroorotate dehydrogenase electron transfer subunit
MPGMNESCLPPAPFVQEEALVTYHGAASTRYFLLRLRCEQTARRAQQGQFVMLACAPSMAGTSEPLLPRPLAVLDARGDEIELLYFVGGQGTEILRRTCEAAQQGGIATRLRIIGPLGRGFSAAPGVDAHVAVGGGSGIVPLVFFYRRCAASPCPPRGEWPGAQETVSWHLLLGTRTAAHMPRADILDTPGHHIRATDDGSAGFHGTVVEALQTLLDGELSGGRVAIYAAGPEAMMRAAARLARARGLPCRVSLEQRMACGVGVCRACVVDGAAPHPKTGLLRRTVCQDGPVFDIDELAGW